MATKKTIPTKRKPNSNKKEVLATQKIRSKAATVKQPSVTKDQIKPTKQRRNISFVQQMKGLHQFSAGIFILLAILAGYFIKDTTLNLTIDHLTLNGLASHATSVFAPAVHGVYDINLRWVVVAIMVLSAILPLLWVLRWQRQYEMNIAAEVMPQRWLDLGLIGAILVAVIALLSGEHDVMTLLLIGGLVVISFGIGWLTDKQNRQVAKPDWSAYAFSLISGGLPWVLIGITAFATYIYGLVRSPWYVYVLYGTTLLGFATIARMQYQHNKLSNQWKFSFLERNYTLVGLFIKAAFAIVLIVGLHR